MVSVESFEIKQSNQFPKTATIRSNIQGKFTNTVLMAFQYFASQSEPSSVSQCPLSVNSAIDDSGLLRNVSTTTQLLLRKPTIDQQYHVNFPKTKENFNSITNNDCGERTLYDILGTTPTATKEELKRQYIKLAKCTHPDAIISQQRSDPNAYISCDFSEIASAYRVLSNPLERKRYDRTLQSARSIVLLTLLGEVLIGTTLTVAEISSTLLLVALTIFIQPISVRAANDLFIARNSNQIENA
jgi:DnaJ-domain-containing protein 1